MHTIGLLYSAKPIVIPYDFLVIFTHLVILAIPLLDWVFSCRGQRCTFYMATFQNKSKIFKVTEIIIGASDFIAFIGCLLLCELVSLHNGLKYLMLLSSQMVIVLLMEI